MVRPSRRVIEVVVFDVGETLVDEEHRAWSEQADAAGVPRLTLFGALGALIERGEHHRDVWSLLGIEAPSVTSEIRPRGLLPRRDSVPTGARRPRPDAGVGSQPARRRSDRTGSSRAASLIHRDVSLVGCREALPRVF